MRTDVNSVRLSMALVLLCTAPALVSAQIRHLVFQSNATFIAPEVNVVLFNDGDKPVSVEFGFGTRGADLDLLTDNTCYSRNRARQFTGGRFEEFDPKKGLKRFNMLEPDLSIADIAPKSFAHRYYPVGFFSAYPCEILYILTDLPDGKIRTHQFTVKPVLNMPAGPAKDVTVQSSVEAFSDHKRIYITLLFNNQGKQAVHLDLVRKSVTGCAADIQDGIVRQGMEGGTVEIAPNSYAAAKTVIALRKRGSPANCRLMVEYAGSGGSAVPEHLRSITVSMKQSGKFRFWPSVMLHQ